MPASADLELARSLVRGADELGLDLVGIQDHPYQWRFLPEHWIETLTEFARELGFDTFVFWPDEEPLEQLRRFAEQVVPVLRG